MNSRPSNNLWLFLELLAKRRGLIFSIVTLATVAAIVVSFLLPKWYKATALLLPPKNTSTPIAGLNILSEVVSVTGGLNLPAMATPSDVSVRMLTSRTVTGRVIDRFGLKERYDTENYEEAYLELMDLADIRVTDEGLVSVSAEDKDPRMAADIANAFVDELDRVNREIVSQRADQTRTFIEERVDQVAAELDSARKDLEEFQMEHKAVDFDEQMRLSIEQAIQLKVALAEIDLELKVSAITLGKDNAELVELKRRRGIIQGQLSQLENTNPDSSFFSLPVSAIPALKGQYETFYSKVRVAEALYQVLLEQLEHVKIKQYEDLPTISVLDRAQPPEIRSRPRRTVIVLGTFGLSLIFSVFLAAVREYLSRLKDDHPEDYERAMLFISAFFGWLPGVKKSAGARHDKAIR